MKRVHNFSAGPCCLPEAILSKSQNELLSWQNSGQSVMEMSHRSKEFISIYHQTVADLKDLLAVPDSHEILFMAGGATLQFASIPLNIFSDFGVNTADFVITGSWGKKAQEECAKYGTANIVCDSSRNSNGKYIRVPPVKEWNLSPGASYLHYCANETVMGVEFDFIPEIKIPLISDMSSNFCSKPIDVSKHTIIYAGVQKNLGPAGCAVVVIDKSFINDCKPSKYCPAIMNYQITMKNESMYNTPPCWVIYMTGLMASYLKKTGGLTAAAERSMLKSQLLYDYIDKSDGYYLAPVEIGSRSRMNVPFRVGHANEELEKLFVKEAEKSDLVNLGGHRSVGGCRASLYNGMSIDGVEKLVEFMKDFKDQHAC